MKKIAFAILFLILGAAAQAQTTQTFLAYVTNLVTASLPYNGTEFIYLVQSGVSRKANLNNLGALITQGLTVTTTAITSTAGQISYGGTTVAPGANTCPSGTVGGTTPQTVVGCVTINVAGTTRFVPFF